MKRLNNGIVALLGAAGVIGTVGAEPPVPNMSILTTENTGTHIVSVVDQQASNTELMHISTSNVLQLYAAGGTPITPPSGMVTIDWGAGDRTDGFTLTITINNTTSTAVDQAVLSFNDIWLQPDLAPRNFQAYSQAFQLASVDAPSTRVLGPLQNYPGGYSPVLEFSNNLADDVVTPPSGYTPPGTKYAVGFSMIYPIITYGHPVDFRVEQQLHDFGGGVYGASRSHPHWTYLAIFNYPSNADYNSAGMVPAGQTRTYELHVRICRTDRGEPNNWWLRTLEVYRRYFHDNFGGVTYARDGRPVDPINMSISSLCSGTNTYGFESAYNLATHGFGGITGELDTRESTLGFRRHMLWAPSGSYCATGSTQFNIPFRFTSNWSTFGLDPEDLATWASSKHLGLWWGFSSRYHSQWNPTSDTPLDPTNGTHMDAALAELDGAVRAGVKEVGLDTFPLGGAGRSFARRVYHIETLRAAAPDMTFVIEPAPCDILHTYGPAWVPGYASAVGWVGTYAPHACILPNFLLPGNEIWYQLAETLNESNSTDVANYRTRMQLLAKKGLTIVDTSHTVFPAPSPSGSPISSAYTARDAASDPEAVTPLIPIDVLRCSAMDITFDDGTPIRDSAWTAETLDKANSGITSSDALYYFSLYSANDPAADITDDYGVPLPPFGNGTTNTGITSADLYYVFTHMYDTCP